jgi:ADP-ribose pyrophosphatase YjhB (NUDIX family)
LPKGNLKSGESHKKGCKREAFEEAGVKGQILTDFPMTHVVTKTDNGALSQVAVTYYPMLVSKQFDEWPEQPKRERHWALLDDAPRVTDREDFRLVINQFAAIKPLILTTAKHKKA